MPQRELNLDTLALKPGKHNPNSGDMCIMEAVAYIAGEPWSDHPKCVSRVIGAFLRRLNDQVSDDRRQELKPYITRVIGSVADDEVERRRAWQCANWVIRECLPLMFDARGRHDEADRFRALDEMTADNWRVQRAAATYAAADAAAAAATYAAAAAAADAAAYAADAARVAAAYAAYADADDAAYAISHSALSLIDRLLAV